MLKRAVSCVVSMAMCACLAQAVALADEVAGSNVQGEEVVADEEGTDVLTVAADGDIELPPISFPSSPSSGTDEPSTDNKGENELPEDVITDNDISKIATVTIAKHTYTGRQIKPAPVVTRLSDAATLVKGTDYTLSWGKNTNAGTGTVTIKGKGNYVGSLTVNFPIVAASLSKSAKVAAIASRTYTGKQIKPKPTVTLASGGAKLVKDKDYTLTWGTNKKVGKGTVTIKGKGNYQGSKTITFSIVEPAAPKASYRVRVQGSGWTKYAKGGAVAGKSKRVGAVQIKLAKSPYKGGIQYRTLQQSGKWQAWKKDGKVSGTAKGSKRVEAIQIKLYGELAKHYDVYYRVCTQDFGWMGWAKNGAKAGTAGYSYRLEAIQIVVVKKGAKKPAKSYKGVKTVTAAAFKQKK